VSLEALGHYLHSSDRRTLVAVMGMASRRPEIWIDTIASREGFDRLAMLMGYSEDEKDQHR
jgi:hypothetical protein